MAAVKVDRIRHLSFTQNPCQRAIPTARVQGQVLAITNKAMQTVEREGERVFNQAGQLIAIESGGYLWPIAWTFLSKSWASGDSETVTLTKSFSLMSGDSLSSSSPTSLRFQSFMNLLFELVRDLAFAEAEEFG